MNLNKIPEQLAVDLLERSICNVQVAAVLVDHNDRIFGWGWNNSGKGFGIHAERHAISRANRNRLVGANIFVAAVRGKRLVIAKPCEECMPLLVKYSMNIFYRDKEGRWKNA